jgi:hypothetical protein
MAHASRQAVEVIGGSRDAGRSAQTRRRAEWWVAGVAGNRLTLAHRLGGHHEGKPQGADRISALVCRYFLSLNRDLKPCLLER